MPDQSIVLSVVCPFFNEEEVVDFFMEKIHQVLNTLDLTYEIVCVNDGSLDRTLEKLILAKKSYPNLRILDFSRNFGKEAALTAGLDHARGKVIVPIDADLQDPPELIIDFIEKWREGYEVVVGKRVDRSTDGLLKRMTAQLYYRFHNKISNQKIPENVGDFRLITRRVVEAIQQMPENQRFMKGIFAWVGFNTCVVAYKRQKRRAGKTSFHGWGLWNFALDGITSFSTVPLRVWLYIGSLIALISLVYGSYIILRTLVFGVDLPGYASLLVSILFLGGVQLMGIGVLGEYLGRIYLETKHRPQYIVDKEY
ncbi:putative glycosyltransferase [Desulforapulum autotrophicum HRM2]|uniref:Glycosyltransferase n=1 Tax=Desulforapulum autotrophicum (strain ATCC 43914 / DSM 3382 / VKM B-1955 / HRM2) TaxID=177437 RepID=C0QK48_DESAH|nr:glycosyltransferase family 2 protein [Desulforapulum autotrophicum]ACN16074.1 putative glycosyltransferase [Desulforapulum autotrophicum HRM2]